ncbi:hypothetical protein [Enterovibrio calviensis]|uniref:hypothetical protein n=1 Tax=Enterovibrio calviensis TaxID=91359 RepID=UPI0037352539
MYIRLSVLAIITIFYASPLLANITKQELVCKLTNQTPSLIDSPVGSIRNGHLNIYGSGSGATYVINIGGSIINTDFGSWKDDGNKVVIKSNIGAAILVRSTGELSIYEKYGANSFNSSWDCTLL